MQKMTTNDAIIRHNFISKVIFKDGDTALSKDLKIKIMSMRIEYGKIHKIFDSDVQEFTQGIMEDRFKENVDRFFKFNDRNNCKRVYEWILEH